MVGSLSCFGLFAVIVFDSLRILSFFVFDSIPPIILWGLFYVMEMTVDLCVFTSLVVAVSCCSVSLQHHKNNTRISRVIILSRIIIYSKLCLIVYRVKPAARMLMTTTSAVYMSVILYVTTSIHPFIYPLYVSLCAFTYLHLWVIWVLRAFDDDDELQSNILLYLCFECMNYNENRKKYFIESW